MWPREELRETLSPSLQVQTAPILGSHPPGRGADLVLGAAIGVVLRRDGNIHYLPGLTRMRVSRTSARANKSQRNMPSLIGIDCAFCLAWFVIAVQTHQVWCCELSAGVGIEQIQLN